MNQVRFAYIADGRLYLVRPGEAPKLVTSPFAEASFARDPSGPVIAPAPDGGPPRIVIPKVDRVYFTGAARGAAPGELVYSVYTGAVTAICALSAAGEERRLVHAASAQLSQVALDRVGGRLVAASRDSVGAHIVLFRDDGREKRILTSDDAIDSEPCFERSPDGPPRAVLFHRQDRVLDGAGNVVDLALARLYRVDLETGDETQIASHPDRECVAPKTSPDGARFHLSIPLMYAPPPSAFRRSIEWLRRGFLAGWEASASRLGLEPPGFAWPPPPPLPAFVADETCVLVRTSEGGERVLSDHVLAYDIAADGRILISDGRVVRALGADGVASAPLAEAAGITLVAALDGEPDGPSVG